MDYAYLISVVVHVYSKRVPAALPNQPRIIYVLNCFALYVPLTVSSSILQMKQVL